MTLHPYAGHTGFYSRADYKGEHSSNQAKLYDAEDIVTAFRVFIGCQEQKYGVSALLRISM